MSLEKQENAKLKAIIYEQKSRIKMLEQEISSYKLRERNISSAIGFAVERSGQIEDSRNKIYELDIQRTRLLYVKLESVLNEIYAQYPNVRANSKLKSTIEKFKQAIFKPAENPKYSYTKTISQAEDPIRRLLNNINSCIETKPETRVIKRADGYGDAVEDVSSVYASTPNQSGFNINEALHPTESLEDILKSFNLTKTQSGK